MSKSSFVIYIDESGDEGFFFTKGSSHWFILSAVITRKENDLNTVKIIDEIRTLIGKRDKSPLHFRKLKHHHRIPYIASIAKSSLRTVSILVHKPSLKEPEKFQERYRLYSYTIRYLLERVSWLCRDNKRSEGDGSAEIIFSNRSSMSYDEIRKYLDVLKEQTKTSDIRIEWSVINSEKIAAFTADKRMGLQLADAVASSFFYALEPTYGYTEDRYARMLKPVIYHRKGNYLGYGLKFWPREVDSFTDFENFDWINIYK